MIALTCPHCESPLLILDECRTAQVMCAGCQGILPNPVQPAEPTPGIVVASSPELQAGSRRRLAIQRVCLLIFGILGAALAALFGMVVIGSAESLFVLGPLMMWLAIASIRWTQQREPTISWFIGWIVLILFSICCLSGLLGVLWVALLVVKSVLRI